MTSKQKAVLLSIHSGQTIAEASKALGIKKQSLYNMRHRMLMAGLLKKPPRPILTKMQRNVLYCYMQKQTVPEIAKHLGLTCQTVMNHANTGFARLNLMEKGVDRVAALHAILEPITMDDPFFN